MFDLAKPTVIVCHDAGAANLIFGWLKAEGVKGVRAYMEGPAAALWHRVFSGQTTYDSLDEAMDGAQSLVSGTGWASSLEHHARVLAHSRGKYSVAVLDHWVNYTARFERNGRVEWPDEVWVADAEALDLARKSLPGVHVVLRENLYLAEQVSRIGPPPNNGTILVLLEPVRETWGRSNSGEFQALEYLFDHISQLLTTGVVKVLLRPHPSEPEDKYQRWLTLDSRVCIDTSPDAAAAIAQADVVVGLESFALTIALAAGRPVFSSLPPWAPPLRLPHSGIREIRHMVQL